MSRVTSGIGGRIRAIARAVMASAGEPQPELIVIARPGADLAPPGAAAAAAAGTGLDELIATMAQQGLVMRPLFAAAVPLGAGAVAPTVLSNVAEPELLTPDVSVVYKVQAPPDRMPELADVLRGHDAVEAAYVTPAPRPANLNTMVAAPSAPPSATPDFEPGQEYLLAAPGGIDAHAAWNHASGGGGGRDVRIIDIEGAWRFAHEDHVDNLGGVIAGIQQQQLNWRNHGTAVIGEMIGNRNGFGVTGICPDANVRAIAAFGANWNPAAAIRKAADVLRPGDLILVELHQPGPRFNFAAPSGQDGFIAMEWWPHIYLAIRYATQKGVIVVEAAGNGREDLDDVLYDANPAPPHGPFPAWWSNPFRRAANDSGAVVVGAGAPPPGTHGRTHGVDRSRLDFSNFGSLVDAQGWGREVTTTGYGDLQGGPDEDRWYTEQFSGTSSASPIVVGALACLQGAMRASGMVPLNPMNARQILRSTGSPQQAGATSPVTERIGNRPDLSQMLAAVFGGGPQPP